MNGKEIKYTLKDVICSLKDCQSVTVNYTISNIGPPQLNYIFIADILDYLNSSKAKNESLFSECVAVYNCIFVWNAACLNIVLDYLHNNVYGMFKV